MTSRARHGPKTHYLREWRIVRGLTQMQLAERSGRSQSAIAGYETGSRGLSVQAQRDFAEALGLEPLELFRHPDATSLDALLADQPEDIRATAERLVRALLAHRQG